MPLPNFIRATSNDPERRKKKSLPVLQDVKKVGKFYVVPNGKEAALVMDREEYEAWVHQENARKREILTTHLKGSEKALSQIDSLLARIPDVDFVKFVESLKVGIESAPAQPENTNPDEGYFDGDDDEVARPNPETWEQIEQRLTDRYPGIQGIPRSISL